MPTQQQNEVGYTFQNIPDVIKCGGYFYYLMQTSSTLSIYYAFSFPINYYKADKNGLIQKSGPLPDNCQNTTFEQLWASNRAFRIFNLDRAPNRSIENDNTLPDIIKCSKTNILYRIYRDDYYKYFENCLYKTTIFNSSSGNLFSEEYPNCGKSSSINNLIAENQAFNITTKQSTVSTPSISMTGRYPDLILCKDYSLYIHHISSDQTQVIYFSPAYLEARQLKFVNGNYHSNQNLWIQCLNRSINTLIGEGNAFDLNTPLLMCPNDIQTRDQRVIFEARQTGSLTLSYSHQSNSLFPIGLTTNVTVTANHRNFNIALECTFGVTILDQEAPNITCPANIRQENHLTVSFIATATDNSGMNPTIVYSVEPGTKFSVGQTLVKVTATDGSGNQSQCTLSVTIIDSQAPNITCPGNITQQNELNVRFAATATDNSEVNPTLVYSVAPGSNFAVGKTIVTVTATDGSGNQSQCTLNVTIIDSLAPKLTCPGSIIQQNNQIATYNATATDNSGVNPTIDYSIESGSSFPFGETLIRVNATDSSGNQSYCTLNVTIIDSQAPNITCPAKIIQQNIFSVSYNAKATDNSGVSPQFSYSIAPGSTFSIGQTYLTITATDGSRNQSNCTLIVEIIDSRAPSLACPQNIDQQNDQTVNFDAIATDNSGLPPTITYSTAPGSQFQYGETVVTVVATDVAGNQTQCSFTVTVLKLEDNKPSTQIIVISAIGGLFGLLGIIFGFLKLKKCKKQQKYCFKKKTSVRVLKIDSERMGSSNRI